MGPSISGPRLVIWGGNANALESPTFYIYIFCDFLPCGTMFPFYFEILGYVAASQALDAIASNEARRSRGLGSIRSPSNARAQNQIVDHVSRHRTLEIWSCFRWSWGNMWTHQSLLNKIGRAIFAGSWEHGPLSSHDRGRRSIFTESDVLRYSRTFFIKLCSSSLGNSTLDWIMEELSGFWAKS